VSAVAQPRAALKIAAAATALLTLLGVALVLLVATLMGGLAPQACAPPANFAPSAVALADIPGNYLGWIRAAAPRYGIDWTVIAGIYSIESDFGRLNAPGVHLGENFAGAGGPGAGTWQRYGLDGDGDGLKDRYNPADAIPATANLLRQNGAPTDYGRAVFAYNHASWCVDDVLARAARYRGAAQADRGAVRVVGVADAVPACADAAAATGPADLTTAVRRTSPATYRVLPGWVMAGGRRSEQVDARIYDDVLWVLRRFGVRVSAAREAVTTRTATARPWTSGRRSAEARPTGTPPPGAWRTISAGPSRVAARRPARVRADASDPVGRLRRLSQPRIVSNVLGRLSGAHPSLVGLRLLRLERPGGAVHLGDGVPRSGG
jgi:hypothetical protein